MFLSSDSSRLDQGGRLVPRGPIAINRVSPLTAGLIFARVFDGNSGAQFQLGGGDGNSAPSVSSGLTTIGAAPGGLGFYGGGYSSVGAANTGGAGQGGLVPLGTMTELTIACYVTVSSWSGGELVRHDFFGSCDGGNNNDILLSHDSSGNWKGGFITAADTRASGAASGTFVQGTPFLLAFVYDEAATTKNLVYVNGALVASNTTARNGTFSPCIGTTFGRSISVDANYGCPSAGDAYHYAAIWNRPLSANEVAILNRSPGIIFATRSQAVIRVAAAAATVFPFWKTQAMMDGVFRGNHPIDYGV